MTKNENLLIIASEECAEISQAISKAIRFGMQNVNSNDTASNNEYNILVEYYQLQAVFEMLMEQGIIATLNDNLITSIKAEKKVKVQHYEGVSSTLGILRG